MSVLLGGLVLVTVTAGPAVACSCPRGPDAAHAAHADAIFVGELLSSRVVPSASTRKPGSMLYADPVVYTFEVSRVYKEAISERQEIVGAGGPCAGFGMELSGTQPFRMTGPFLVFAHQRSKALYPGHRYGASMCSGGRALADGAPKLGGLSARAPAKGVSGPSTASLMVGVGILATVVAAGLVVLRARRRARAD